jgi:hypothetical protein
MPAIASLEDLKAAPKDLLEAKNLEEAGSVFGENAKRWTSAIQLLSPRGHVSRTTRMLRRFDACTLHSSSLARARPI